MYGIYFHGINLNTKKFKENIDEIIGEMGGVKKLRIETYLRTLAKRMIGDSKDASDLLNKIGWGLSDQHYYADGTLKLSGERLVKDRIQDLFGTTYEDAKNKYSTGYLGNV